MNFPSLPTDSLYKFLCLAGLVLAVFSIYLEYTSDTEYNQRVNEFNLKIVALNKEQAIFNQESDFIVERMKRKCADCNCGCTFVNATQEGLRYNFAKGQNDNLPLKRELDQLEADHMKKYWEIEMRQAESQELGRILDHESSVNDETETKLLRLLWLGIGLFLSGISFWAIKIQRPQDKILAYELKKKQQEYTDNKTKQTASNQ